MTYILVFAMFIFSISVNADLLSTYVNTIILILSFIDINLLFITQFVLQYFENTCFVETINCI